MATLIERLYAAGAHAGFLRTCTWQPPDGSAAQTQLVGWAATDQNVLSGLTSSTEYVMTYPSTCFVGLAAREVVQIEGVAYQVREVTALRDGSELQAKLMRV